MIDFVVLHQKEVDLMGQTLNKWNQLGDSFVAKLPRIKDWGKGGCNANISYSA
jgi:hypothetical protein